MATTAITKAEQERADLTAKLLDLSESPTVFQGDNSRIEKASLSKLTTILTATFGAAHSFVGHVEGLYLDTADIARLSFDARELCLTGGDANPDWAAGSEAFTEVFAKPLRRYCDDVLGYDYGKVQQKVSSWINDNGYSDLRILAYGARTDSKAVPEGKAITALLEKVTKRESVPTDAKPKLSEEAQSYLRAQRGFQKTPKGKTRPGWDPADTTAAGTPIGMTKAQRAEWKAAQLTQTTPDTSTTGNGQGTRYVSMNVPQAEWEKLGREVSAVHEDNETFAYSSLMTAQQLRLLASKWGAAIAPEVAGGGKVKETTKVAAEIGETIEVLTHLRNYLTARNAAERTKAAAEMRTHYPSNSQ